MSDLSQMSAHELVAQVELRNRQFKIASVVFGAILVAGVALLFVIGLNTLTGVRAQLTQQRSLLDSQQQILSRIQDSSEQRTKQINDLQQHIDCVVELLRKSNRQQLKITDIQTCQIVKTSTSGGSAGSTKSSSITVTPQQITNNPGVSKSTTSTPPSKQTPTKQPVRSLLCRITLSLLGCNKKS